MVWVVLGWGPSLTGSFPIKRQWVSTDHQQHKQEVWGRTSGGHQGLKGAEFVPRGCGAWLGEGSRRVPGSRRRGRHGSTPCNEAADDGFTSSITLCGAYVYVVATSIKRGQISCVCAAAKLAVVTFPSASLLYNPLLPLKLRAREKPPPCQLLVLAALLIPSPQHRAQA